MTEITNLPVWLIYPFLAFLLALIVHRLAWLLAGLFLGPVAKSSSGQRRFFGRFRHLDPDKARVQRKRRETLQHLTASIIRVAAFVIAILVTLSLFVSLDTLIWLSGFLTAAFAFGARPLVGDLLAGFNIIFEDIFGVGEKIEVKSSTGLSTATGVVEHVSLRTTWVRASTGELFVVPNGDVRTVRNFSRGRFSMANITLKIVATDLHQALPLLTELGQEAVTALSDLLEPWQVISESGTIGQHAELTLIAKSRFGRAADMRPHLLALVQERLAEADITLVG